MTGQPSAVILVVQLPCDRLFTLESARGRTAPAKNGNTHMEFFSKSALLVLGISLGSLLAGCDPELESAPDEVPSTGQFPVVDIVIGADVDVSISDEEFESIIEEYGVQWDAPDDDDAAPAGEGDITPRLSNSCSIAPSLKHANASWSPPASKAPACYGYAYFGGDYSEADCYIKFTNYAKKSEYMFTDLNECAAAATLWYGFDLTSYYDSGANVYLRMDRKWCADWNCEDGFRIKY